MRVYKNICRIFAEAINRKVFKLLFRQSLKHLFFLSVFTFQMPQFILRTYLQRQSFIITEKQ